MNYSWLWNGNSSTMSHPLCGGQHVQILSNLLMENNRMSYSLSRGNRGLLRRNGGSRICRMQELWGPRASIESPMEKRSELRRCLSVARIRWQNRTEGRTGLVNLLANEPTSERVYQPSWISWTVSCSYRLAAPLRIRTKIRICPPDSHKIYFSKA